MKKIAIILLQLIFVFALNAQTTTRYTTANLNLRTDPSVSSSVIAVVPQGTLVYLEEDCNCAWIPISYNGEVGYVSTKYLSKEKVNSPARATGGVRHYTNSNGDRVQSPTHYNKAPAGATALCRNGTYSFSRSRRGTCSHHGGVAKWL